MLRFGKIDYLNLLPFHVFLKRRLRHSRSQMLIRYGRNVPSAINRAFETRRIDAAFISSIKAPRYRRTPLGIVARGAVQSVLLIPGDRKDDAASATSNVLASVLGLEGEVLIGDRALRAYLEGVEAIDLAQTWQERTGLPFVFAVLCHHGHDREIATLSKAFLRRPVRIPGYLLKQASERTGIAPDRILAYLTNITYRIDHRAERGLKLFWKSAKKPDKV